MLTFSECFVAVDSPNYLVELSCVYPSEKFSKKDIFILIKGEPKNPSFIIITYLALLS